MKKYGVLLFDVDGTLLDFDRAEEMGIEGLLEHYGVPVTCLLYTSPSPRDTR